jgi:hypothetical protein
MKPKAYLALDWDDINELEKKARNLVDLDTNDVDWHIGNTTLDIIKWMREKDIYTRPFKDESPMSVDKQKQLLVEIMDADAKDGLYNQMTSVEWLWNLSKTRELDKFDLEQAEEMHKKEIIEAANLTKEQRWYDDKLYNSCGQQYYDKTYNK